MVSELERIVANAIHEQSVGRYEAAEELYIKALALQPNHAQVQHNLGLLAMQNGRTARSVEFFRLAVVANPGEPQFWLSFIKGLIAAGLEPLARQTLVHGRTLGLAGDEVQRLAERLNVRETVPSECINAVAALIDAGQAAQAERLARALTISLPAYPAAWAALGAALRAQGSHQDAIPALEKAASLAPGDAAAHCNLGSALFDIGNTADSLHCYEIALAIAPQMSEAWYFRGNCEARLENTQAAEESFHKAIALNASLYVARFNLAMIQIQAGRVDDAIVELEAMIKTVSNIPASHYELGKLYQVKGRWDDAEKAYQAAIKLKPGNPDAFSNLSIVLLQEKRLQEAVEACEQALKLDRDHVQAHANLGLILKALGDNGQSEKIATRAKELALLKVIELEPENPGGHANLGILQVNNGQLDHAISSFKWAIELQSDHLQANEGLMYTYAWNSMLPPLQYLEEAKKWEKRVIPENARLTAKVRIFENTNNSGRPLRVGYVSGDFREHSVSYFMEGIVENNNSNKAEIYLYSNSNEADAVTERYKKTAANWRDIFQNEDEKVIELIISDKIDVLVDISGYTGRNRLGVFARRAAPVQVHYLGFAASTGISQMDYWMADEILVPPSHDEQFSEKVWRLNRPYVSYRPRPDAPDISRKPDDDGVVWLGCFHQFAKLSKSTLALWAVILNKVPQAKLLLKTKALEEGVNAKNIQDIMKEYGISSDRLKLVGNTRSWSEHMAVYNEIDIALDPIGSPGGATTTCDAFWMGVPVIALAGERTASRMTASLIHGLEHDEWIADNLDDYVNKVVKLINDKNKRISLRIHQRELMKSSLLCNTIDLSNALNDAYGKMYKTWYTNK